MEKFESIIQWMAEVEGTMMSSPSSQIFFTGQEVEEIVNRFQGILVERLSPQQLELMMKAVSVLIATRCLTGRVALLVDLMCSLLNSFLWLYQSEDATQAVLRDLSNQVTDLLSQMEEQGEQKGCLLEGLCEMMLGVVVNSNLQAWLRKNWLKSLNVLLGGTEGQLRQLLCDENRGLVEKLVDFLYVCGDFDTQASVVECLQRFTLKSSRSDLACAWFPDYALVQSLFVRIKEFETDCRSFLNCFNEGLNVHQLVHSLPALSCSAGGVELFKPPDVRYTRFWVDFNLGPGSISLFCVRDPASPDMWDMMTITGDSVMTVTTSSQAGVVSVLITTTESPHSSQSQLSSSDKITEFVFPSGTEVDSLLSKMFPQQFVPGPKPPKVSSTIGTKLRIMSSGKLVQVPPQPAGTQGHKKMSSSAQPVRCIVPSSRGEFSSDQPSSLPCAQASQKDVSSSKKVMAPEGTSSVRQSVTPCVRIGKKSVVKMSKVYQPVVVVVQEKVTRGNFSEAVINRKSSGTGSVKVTVGEASINRNRDQETNTEKKNIQEEQGNEERRSTDAVNMDNKAAIKVNKIENNLKEAGDKLREKRKKLNTGKIDSKFQPLAVLGGQQSSMSQLPVANKKSSVTSAVHCSGKIGNTVEKEGNLGEREANRLEMLKSSPHGITTDKGQNGVMKKNRLNLEKKEKKAYYRSSKINKEEKETLSKASIELESISTEVPRRESTYTDILRKESIPTVLREESTPTGVLREESTFNEVLKETGEEKTSRSVAEEAARSLVSEDRKSVSPEAVRPFSESEKTTQNEVSAKGEEPKECNVEKVGKDLVRDFDSNVDEVKLVDLDEVEHLRKGIEEQDCIMTHVEGFNKLKGLKELNDEETFKDASEVESKIREKGVEVESLVEAFDLTDTGVESITPDYETKLQKHITLRTNESTFLKPSDKTGTRELFGETEDEALVITSEEMKINPSNTKVVIEEVVNISHGGKMDEIENLNSNNHHWEESEDKVEEEVVEKYIQDDVVRTKANDESSELPTGGQNLNRLTNVKVLSESEGICASNKPECPEKNNLRNVMVVSEINLDDECIHVENNLVIPSLTGDNRMKVQTEVGPPGGGCFRAKRKFSMVSQEEDYPEETRVGLETEKGNYSSSEDFQRIKEVLLARPTVQGRKKFGRVSSSPSLGKLTEEPQGISHTEKKTTDKEKKIIGKQKRKTLMALKSLMLAESASDSAGSESKSNLSVIPTYEEVHHNKTPKAKAELSKTTVRRKLHSKLDSKKISVKSSVPSAKPIESMRTESPKLPPLMVNRIDFSTNSTLNSTRLKTRKFFKSKQTNSTSFVNTSLRKTYPGSSRSSISRSMTESIKSTPASNLVDPYRLEATPEIGKFARISSTCIGRKRKRNNRRKSDISDIPKMRGTRLFSDASDSDTECQPIGGLSSPPEREDFLPSPSNLHVTPPPTLLDPPLRLLQQTNTIPEPDDDGTPRPYVNITPPREVCEDRLVEGGLQTEILTKGTGQSSEEVTEGLEEMLSAARAVLRTLSTTQGRLQLTRQRMGRLGDYWGQIAGLAKLGQDMTVNSEM